jgi:hypothetical protein
MSFEKALEEEGNKIRNCPQLKFFNIRTNSQNPKILNRKIYCVCLTDETVKKFINFCRLIYFELILLDFLETIEKCCSFI